MRVAILHDYLNQFGGAERVLKTFLEIFPEADVYTLLYDNDKTKGIFSSFNIKTSFLNYKFIKNHHRLFIPFMPLASQLLKGEGEYDLVISSTAGYAKGFNVKGKYHISYCHSPLRYAWEIDYLKDLPFAPKPLSNFFAYPVAKMLRRWDKKKSQNVNIFIANSTFTAERIKSYYNRFALVLNPPIDTKIFHILEENKKPKEEYYLMAGRFIYYKNFDLGIKAFNFLSHKNLKIVGQGPEEKKLKKLCRTKNIEFLGHVKDEDLCKIYNKAKALIFPQIEDFGLVAAEAQACGLPIIAYGVGGINDIIINGKTGILFNKQTPEALIKAINEFEKVKWQRKFIAQKAQRFSKQNFIKNFKKILKNCGINF